MTAAGAAVTLWRIAAETRDYKADDLSGAGAAASAGRWNARGEHVIYAAQTVSLAALETAAHLQDTSLPLDRFVVALEVPADVWRARSQLDVSALDPAWCAIPGGRASVDAGSRWYQSRASALLLVPSVVVPEECAVLINASHDDAARIRATTVRRFEFNRLFRA